MPGSTAAAGRGEVDDVRPVVTSSCILLLGSRPFWSWRSCADTWMARAKRMLADCIHRVAFALEDIDVVLGHRPCAVPRVGAGLILSRCATCGSPQRVGDAVGVAIKRTAGAWRTAVPGCPVSWGRRGHGTADDRHFPVMPRMALRSMVNRVVLDPTYSTSRMTSPAGSWSLPRQQDFDDPRWPVELTGTCALTTPGLTLCSSCRSTTTPKPSALSVSGDGGTRAGYPAIVCHRSFGPMSADRASSSPACSVLYRRAAGPQPTGSQQGAAPGHPDGAVDLRAMRTSRGLAARHLYSRPRAQRQAGRSSPASP